MIALHLWLFIGFLSLSKSQRAFMPNLPVGEYRIIYDAVHRCQASRNHKIVFNLYFNKKAKNITEIKGNITLNVPFDDDLMVEANLWSWRLTGGWTENSLVQTFDKCCSIIKMLSGKAWFSIMEAFHFPTKNCPLPKGTYTTSGVDVRVIDDNNLPKVYFYGKYKLELRIRYKNNTSVGCIAMDFRLVRPWELPQY